MNNNNYQLFIISSGVYSIGVSPLAIPIRQLADKPNHVDGTA